MDRKLCNSCHLSLVWLSSLDSVDILSDVVASLSLIHPRRNFLGKSSVINTHKHNALERNFASILVRSTAAVVLCLQDENSNGMIVQGKPFIRIAGVSRNRL